MRSREWTLGLEYGGGAIFGNPKRGRSGLTTGSIGLVVPGKTAPRSGGSGVPARKRDDAPSTEALAGQSPETVMKATEGGGKPMCRAEVEVPSVREQRDECQRPVAKPAHARKRGRGPLAGASPW